MQKSALQVEVLDAFEALTQEICRLCSAISSDDDLIAWVHDEGNWHIPSKQILNAREKTNQVISQLHYLDEQAPKETILLPGFIGASSQTLDLVNRVNDCKDRFKNSVLALKRVKINPAAAHSDPSKILKKMGLGRLHLKQCYRKIPVLSHSPQKISWTWAHTRSIKKISVSQAKELLHQRGNDVGIHIQLQKLGQLSEHESLAIVQELAPHLRANVVLSDHSQRRIMIKGPIPLFFPCQTSTPYPKFKPPKEKQTRNENRSIRSDVRLEPLPYLPAIRAHRYA